MSTRVFLFIALCFFSPVTPKKGDDAIKACPSNDPNIISRSEESSHGGQTRVNIYNDSPYDVLQYWIGFDGTPHMQSVVGAKSSTQTGSYPGHVFKWYKLHTNELVLTVRVKDAATMRIKVKECGLDHGANLRLYEPGRDKEFEKLTTKNPGKCVGESADWTCFKHWSYEEVQAREPTKYGFLASEGPAGRTVDPSYISHIPKMIRVTDGPGFLIMEQTDRMKEIISTWYKANKNTPSEIQHGDIPGGYTNVHEVPITKIPLDNFSEVHVGIIKEMQQVLQWWTNQRLKHTSTFGCRIYKRGSMLIDHVDRSDTHLASAVIQVAQDGIDEGWPLELLVNDPETNTFDESLGRIEIYLQPGQMVLYEGGWVMHGRPMRLVGEEFANIFSHFAPINWKGPYKKYKKDEL